MAKVNNSAKAALGKIGSIDAPSASFANTKSINFDGVDDRIVCGTAGYDQCSLQFWLKITDAAYNMVFGKENDNSWYIAVSGGKLYMSIQMFGSAASTTAFNDGNWHQLVVTMEGSSGASCSVKVYLDGSLDKTHTGSNTYTNTTDEDIIIGGWTAALPLSFTGNIDEVAVWDEVVLDAAAITQLYNSGEPIDLKTDSGNYDNASDLTSWWRMGDGDTFPTIQDNQGSNNGTMTNMVSGDIESDVASA